MVFRTAAMSCCCASVLALTLALAAQQPAAGQPAASPASAAQPQAAAQRRIHTLGYQAGYAIGQSAAQNHQAYNVQNQPLYASGNQGYEAGSGLSLQAYRANYREGFEAGYDDGYYGRQETPAAQPSGAAAANAPASGQPAAPSTADQVPAGTVLHLRLQNALSTNNSQANEPFAATLTQPVENSAGQVVLPQGSEVLGHVGQVHAASGLSGQSTMQLKFEQIRLPNGHTAQLRATVAKVGQTGSGVGSTIGRTIEGSPSANQEGQVQQSRTRGTVGNVAAGGAVGALLGAIIGGGKGAAIGTAAGAGLGAFLASKRGPLNLPAGTPITIQLSEPVYLQ